MLNEKIEIVFENFEFFLAEKKFEVYRIVKKRVLFRFTFSVI